MEKHLEYLYSILMIVVPLLVIYVYRKFLSEKLQETNRKYPPRYNGEYTSPPLGTGNGIGLTLLGDEFRVDMDSYVNYLFFTFLYIPIIPLGCFRITKNWSYSENHKRETTSYKIYGTEKWRLVEVIICYLRAFVPLILVLGIILLIGTIFE